MFCVSLPFIDAKGTINNKGLDEGRSKISKSDDIAASLKKYIWSIKRPAKLIKVKVFGKGTSPSTGDASEVAAKDDI